MQNFLTTYEAHEVEHYVCPAASYRTPLLDYPPIPLAQWEAVTRQYNCHHFYAPERKHIIQNIGFTILTLEVLDHLVRLFQNKRVLEVGAGSGYVSFWLSAMGVDILGIDDYASNYSLINRVSPLTKAPHVLVKNINEIDVTPYDVVLLCWPDQDRSTAYDVLRRMRRGQMLVDVTEGYQGCTATEEYFDLRENQAAQEAISDKLNDAHFSLEGLYDRWGVFQVVN